MKWESLLAGAPACQSPRARSSSPKRCVRVPKALPRELDPERAGDLAVVLGRGLRPVVVTNDDPGQLLRLGSAVPQSECDDGGVPAAISDLLFWVGLAVPLLLVVGIFSVLFVVDRSERKR